MPGRRGLLRALIALFAAPAIWAVVIALGYMLAMYGLRLTQAVVWIAGESYRSMLFMELSGLLPALLALVALRRLTVLRLMLWSGLTTGIAYLIWTAAVVGHPVLHWTALFQASVAILFGFLNAGLFAFLAGVRRRPAAPPQAAA